MTKDLLESLNPAQRQAVEYCDGPELVIAGAGSGKTRVLTYKIAYLLQQGIAPSRIMALTFTNKAAREMKERIASLVDPFSAGRLWMGTFHSILLRMLRLHADRLGFPPDFTIYDAADSRSLVKLVVAELGLDEKQYKPASVAAAISNIKNALVSPERYAADRNSTKADERSGHPMLATIYKMYRDRCRVARAMDFDDILFYANVLLRDNPDILDHYADRFEYILVDEYQDTNFAQSLIVRRLAEQRKRLCVVGDDAQSIYGFRGADISNILSMENRWPDLRIFKLERNYRSTQTIVEAAGSLISHNRGQIPKKVYSENEKGEPIEVIEAMADFEEAALVAAAVSRRLRLSSGSLEDMAILYRTNAQSRPLEEALRRRAIPYRIYGGLTFYQRKEVKDALAYFRLSVNKDDDESLRRIINMPTRGIGDTTMKKVRAMAVEKGVSMWSVISDPEGMELPVNKGTAAKLRAFVSMMQKLQEMAAKADAYSLGVEVFRASGLMEMYISASTPEDVSKRENLDALLTGLKEFVERRLASADDGEPEAPPTMSAFLSEVSLLTDQDSEEEDNEAKITLMTIHAAKGLEFDHVFITGMEENLFPGALSLDNPADLEEERRLLYVAMTRARKTLVMSHANSRFRNGKTEDTVPSRFFEDIDRRFLKGYRRSPFAFGHNRDFNSFRQPSRQPFDDTPSTHFAPRAGSPVRQQPRPTSAPHPGMVKIGKPKRADAAKTPLKNAPFAVGDKVEHSKFGIGTVTDCYADPEPMVEVDFRDVGHKKLLLRFATLNKLS